jgi:cytochrome c556
MKYSVLLSIGAVCGAIAAPPLYSGSHGGGEELNKAVAIRSAHMKLLGHNMAILGPMAKGEAEYDAEQAQAAAGNLAKIAAIEHVGYWPEGTSSDETESRALPAIWTEMDKFEEKIDMLEQATMKLEEAAGEGLEPMKAAFGEVGQACGGCHKPYRKPE